MGGPETKLIKAELQLGVFNVVFSYYAKFWTTDGEHGWAESSGEPLRSGLNANS